MPMAQQNKTVKAKSLKSQTVKHAIIDVFTTTGAKVTSVYEELYGGKTLYVAEIKPGANLKDADLGGAYLRKAGQNYRSWYA